MPNPIFDGPPVREIQRAVAERSGVAVTAMAGKGKIPEHVLARQIAMYLCRELTGKSYAQIGRLFGGRDHSTVMHGVSRVARLMDEKPDFCAAVLELKQELS